jgi:glycosyltransferase involved in cell wall biosynthesis
MSNTNYPLVSVIIPTFNRGFVVFKSIESVLNQRYKNIQCIVIDDGSTDDTTTRIQPYLDRIEYYYQPNQGQGSARNLGLHYSKGEFIATLDSDDEWFPDFISSHLDQMLKHNLTLTFSNYDVYNVKHGRMSQIERVKSYLDPINLNQWHIIDGSVFRDLIVPGVIIPSSGVLKRRSALSYGWDTQVKIADDWMLQLEIAMIQPIKVGFTFERNWKKGHFGDNISLSDLSENKRLGKHFRDVHSDLLYVIQVFGGRLNGNEKLFLKMKLVNFKLEWLIWRVKKRKPIIFGFPEFYTKLSVAGICYLFYVLMRRFFQIILKKKIKLRVS